MVADRYSVEGRDDTFTGIVNDVAELLSSAVGLNANRTDLDKSTQGRPSATDGVYRRQGKSHRTVDHSGTESRYSPQARVHLFLKPDSV
jgi:hypothetical protein